LYACLECGSVDISPTSISNSSLHGVSKTQPVISSASISHSSSLRTNTTVGTLDLTDELQDFEEEVDSNSSSLGDNTALQYTNSTSISKWSLSPCNGQPSLGSTKTAAKEVTKKKKKTKKGKEKNKHPKLPPLTCDPEFFDFSLLTNRNNASEYVDYFSRYSLHRQKNSSNSKATAMTSPSPNRKKSTFTRTKLSSLV